MGLVGSGERELASIRDIPAAELLDVSASRSSSEIPAYMNGMPGCLDEYPDAKAYIVDALSTTRMDLMDMAERCARIQQIINILMDLCKIHIGGGNFPGAHVGKVCMEEGAIFILIHAEVEEQIEIPFDAVLKPQDINIDLPPKAYYPDQGVRMNPIMTGTGITLHQRKIDINHIRHIMNICIRLSYKWREGGCVN